jgi:methionyl-tRNA formyltransferase
VIAFGQKLDNKLINIAPKKAINVHASLLPKYRGAAPINWAIINGERQTGISIITLAEKMDAGQIINQLATDIAPDESAGALHDRLAQMAAPLLLDTLSLIETDKAVYKPQDDSEATRAPKLKKTDAFIDFAEPAEAIRRKILGLWPWPGATAYYFPEKTKKSERTIIADARTISHNNPQNLQPGTLDENLDIICSQDALKITKIKPAGGKLMNFRDFVNGRGCRPGDVFTKVEK